MMPPLVLYKWKDLAIYYTVVASDRQALHVVWHELTTRLCVDQELRGLVPSLMDACL